MNTPMRRAERAVTDPQIIRRILSDCRTMHLALADDGAPYVVPLSFGWRWDGALPELVFHCAGVGRKLNLLRRDPHVAFSIARECGDIPAVKACGWSCAYESVLGEGTARIVDDLEEKKALLACLMRCRTGRDFSFDDRDAAGVTVCCIRVDTLSAKTQKLPASGAAAD